MWKSECPHWQFPSRPLVTLSRVDVALASASYPRNASLPTGSLTNATLVSGAFPQEVASALATHGVAPVTPVAYEEGMDGHLGAGEAPYPRVPSHAQVVLQTNHCQPHQPVANVSLSAIAHQVQQELYTLMGYDAPLPVCNANFCIFTQPKRLTFGAELVSDNLLGQCLGGLNFCQSYAKFLLSRSELPSRWGREDNPFVTLALERRCNYQLSYLIYVTAFLSIHHWGEMVQSRFKSGEIRFPVVPNDHWDAFFLSNHQAPPPPSPQKVAQHLCANYSAGEHSADNSPSQSRQYLATCQVLWTWYFCSTLQLARHLGPPDLIFSCEIQLISRGLTNSHWLVFRPPCIIVISSFFSPRFNSAEMVDVNGSLAIRILP